jgi:hypothetical protein
MMGMSQPLCGPVPWVMPLQGSGLLLFAGFAGPCMGRAGSKAEEGDRANFSLVEGGFGC